MAPNVSAINLVHEGTLPGGEQWSFGLWLAGDGELVTQAQLNQLVADAETASNALVTAIAPLLSSGAPITRLVAYSYPVPNGPAALRAEAPYSGPSSAVTPNMPNQVSLVATLKSDVPTRTATGRIYLPALAASVVNGVLSSPTAQSIATGVANYLTALNASTATDDVVVAGSTAAAVVRVEVDNVLDTQRRRRDSVRRTALGAAAVS